MNLKSLLHTAEKLFYLVAAGWVVYIMITAFCLIAYEVPSGSMLPNIGSGELIGVDKIGYGSVVRLFGKQVNTPKFKSINRGDIMVCPNRKGFAINVNHDPEFAAFLANHVVKERNRNGKTEKLLNGKTLEPGT